MFNNQSEERDKSIPLVFHDTFKQWKIDNGITRKTPKNFYLDNNFFQYVVIEYRDNKTYSQEFGEMLDLLIRKNITSRKFIGYDDEIKDEMYSNALDKVYRYTVNGFNENSGKAFVFYTTACTNAFLEVIKNHYKTKNIAIKILKENRVDAVAYNYDGKDVTDIEDNIKTALSFMEYDEGNDVVEDSSEFIDIITEKYPDITTLKLVVEENAPKFKRKFVDYSYVIPVLYIDINDKVSNEKYLYTISKAGRQSKQKNKVYKSVIVEFLDLRVTNEASGTSPQYMYTKSKVARQHGHQTIFVYSDSWNVEVENPDDKENPIQVGRDVTLSRISDMIEYIQFDETTATGRNLENDYIPTEEYLASELEEPFFFGLHKDRTTRVIMYNQDIDTYINWLNTEENPTRVYSCGRIK